MPDPDSMPAGGGGEAVEGEGSHDGAGGRLAAVPGCEAGAVVDVGGHAGRVS